MTAQDQEQDEQVVSIPYAPFPGHITQGDFTPSMRVFRGCRKHTNGSSRQLKQELKGARAELKYGLKVAGISTLATIAFAASTVMFVYPRADQEMKTKESDPAVIEKVRQQAINLAKGPVFEKAQNKYVLGSGPVVIDDKAIESAAKEKFPDLMQQEVKGGRWWWAMTGASLATIVPLMVLYVGLGDAVKSGRQILKTQRRRKELMDVFEEIRDKRNTYINDEVQAGRDPYTKEQKSWWKTPGASLDVAA